MTTRRRAVGALALAGWLAVTTGCASLLDPRAKDALPEQSWNGRFALTVEPSADFPEGQRNSGSFELTAGQRFTELELLSPLGNTIASARTDARGAVLKTADGKTYEASSADALTEKIFGWRIPVEKLPAWLNGKVAQITDAGADPARPVAGIEEGWRVRFEAWDGQQPMSRPQRLVITYPNRVLLRLIVSPRSTPDPKSQ